MDSETPHLLCVLGDPQQKGIELQKVYFSQVLCVNLSQTQPLIDQYTQMVCQPDAVT